MRVDDFSVEVIVGGKALTEYAPTPNRCTVAYSLFDATSYPVEFEEADPFGETYTQKWPVTPYAVELKNTSPEKVLAAIFVDGRYIGRDEWVYPVVTKTVKGFPVTDEEGAHGHRPFLFSIPRQTRPGEAVSACGAERVATIRVEFYEAVENGQRRRAGDASPRANLGHETVTKDVAKLSKAASVSRAGDAVYDSVQETPTVQEGAESARIRPR